MGRKRISAGKRNAEGKTVWNTVVIVVVTQVMLAPAVVIFLCVEKTSLIMDVRVVDALVVIVATADAIVVNSVGMTR